MSYKDRVKQPYDLLAAVIWLVEHYHPRVSRNQLQICEKIIQHALFPQNSLGEFLILPQEVYMAKRYSGIDFVNFSLSAADEKQFTDWLSKNKFDLAELIEQITGEGLKMSITFVGDQAAFCVTLIGTENTKHHEGKCMSSWAGDPAEAVAIAFYKHVVMCDSGPWPQAASGTRWG